MFKYSGASCPVCHKKFNENDDIVVCPECGAPHHRSCYIQTGHCALEDQHGSGKAWQPPEQPEQRNTITEIHCPNCGTSNPRTNSRCSVCGTPLEGFETAENRQHSQNPYGFNPYARPNGQNNVNPNQRQNSGFGGVPPVPPNPFTTPYGGIDPDETIDDIPARDYVLFTGSNSFYFLPKFKQFASRKRTFIPNWSAFFFTYFYYFYRKMYGLGLLILAAFIVLSIPASIINMSTIQETMLQMELITEPMFNINVTQQLMLMANIFNFLTLGLRVFLGLYTNRLYYSHARNKIISLKEQPVAADEKEYCFAVARAGRTNRKLILTIVIIFASLYFLSVILLSSSMMMLG